MNHIKLFENWEDSNDQSFINKINLGLEDRSPLEKVKYLLAIEFKDRDLRNSHPQGFEFIKELLNELTPQLTQDDMDSLNFTERMYLRNTIQRMNEPTEASEEDKIAELLGRFKTGEISQEEAIEKIKLGFKRTAHF